MHRPVATRGMAGIRKELEILNHGLSARPIGADALIRLDADLGSEGTAGSDTRMDGLRRILVE